MIRDRNRDRDPDWTARRERMVDRLVDRGRIERESTERALRAVPRHAFVPEPRRGSAYEDRPLPIGEGQTISAPHMVAVMCDRLELEAGERVLEIGTGCGYHAAVTAEIVGPGNVYSVEYHGDLARAAEARLDRLGYDVRVRAGDGRKGWPDAAPFDAAYLTCAAPKFPRKVVEQVRPGGRLLAPLGRNRQTLVAAWKRADGALDREEHGAVRFVPLLGEG
jgi:protein-L-isoaspartate(D-aspartate) O-methyltransferase